MLRHGKEERTMVTLSVPNRKADLSQLEGRHLLVGRSEAMRALTRIKSTMQRAASDYFWENGFVQLEAIPGISSVTGACESYDTVFSLPYGEDEAYLIQTGQQHMKMWLAGHEKIWAMNQSYRKETQMPERRATTFNMIEVEVTNCSMEGIQQVIVGVIRRICSSLLAFNKSDLETLGANTMKLQNFSPKIITYSDALAHLEAEGARDWAAGLLPEQERRLTEYLGPVFITHEPKALKFWNIVSGPQHTATVMSSDLFLPGPGETVSCTVREYRRSVLLNNLRDFARDPKRMSHLHKLGLGSPEALEEAYRWYFELDEVEHAGFGIGFSRLVQWIIGATDIRETVEVPRFMGYLEP